MIEYNPQERVEIDNGFQLIACALGEVHEHAESGFRMACARLEGELRDPHLAKVLAVKELERGITKDQRSPISSSSFVITPLVQSALKVAFSVGISIAPFALRETRGSLKRWLGRKHPQFSHAAKMAILRVQMVHASSLNSSKSVKLSAPASTLPAPRLALFKRTGTND